MAAPPLAERAADRPRSRAEGLTDEPRRGRGRRRTNAPAAATDSRQGADGNRSAEDARPGRWSRLGAALLRVLSPVSGLGWLVLVGAVAFIAIGFFAGWVEFAVPGCALLAGFALAVLLTIGRSEYAVDLDLADRRVTVGERAIGRINVRNAARRRLLPAQIELPVGHNSADFPIPSMAPGATVEEVFAIPTSRRAVIVVGPVRSVRGDAFGLVARRVQWTKPVELYVHPQIVTLSGAAAGLLRDLEGKPTQRVTDDDMSFHALREYVPGDDRRNIHWKSTARLGTLMVRQFEDTRRTHTALGLSLDRWDYSNADDFELAVSAFGSIAVQALRDGRDLTALASGQRMSIAGPVRLLDDCCTLGLESAGGALVHATKTIAKDVPQASVAILLSGSLLTGAALRRTTAPLRAGLRTVVLSCSVGAEIDVRTAGVLTQATLGSLADLPRVLRRVIE